MNFYVHIHHKTNNETLIKNRENTSILACDTRERLHITVQNNTRQMHHHFTTEIVEDRQHPWDPIASLALEMQEEGEDSLAVIIRMNKTGTFPGLDVCEWWMRFSNMNGRQERVDKRLGVNNGNKTEMTTWSVVKWAQGGGGRQGEKEEVEIEGRGRRGGGGGEVEGNEVEDKE